MESTAQTAQNRKRARDELESASTQIADSADDSEQLGKRKIVKAQRKAKAGGAVAGEDLEFEDSQEDEFEEEDVVQRDDDDEMGDEWEDQKDDEMQVDENKAPKMQAQEAPKIWNDQEEPLKEDEELEYDGSAYQLLHRSKVEWPCLSLDFLIKERSCPEGPLNPTSWFPSQVNGNLDPANTIVDKFDRKKHRNDRFPMTTYMVAGSQAEKKSDNKIYVMKWSEMYKTVNEDVENSDESDDGNDRYREPVIRFEAIPHKGGVNRIRSMHGSPIVATWNEDGELGFYNVSQAMEELDKPAEQKGQQSKKNYGGSKICGFKHRTEGYALDWSPLTYGRLAAGTCDAALWLYQSADETCSSFVKESTVGLQGHKDSIEDVQWSPTQDHVLASCSVDQTVKLWDLRATQMKPQMSFHAHDCDVNVISWNTTTKFLLASGDDKGEFRIWDLRMLQMQQKNDLVDSITRIRWHTAPITSIQFEPREDSVLAVTSADDKLTLWDFSVEVDESETPEDENDMDIPPQLMFLHQGQSNMKELRFHPQFGTVMATTAEDSFNLFRPNLDPEEDELPTGQQEESKDGTQTASSQQVTTKTADVWVDSDEEGEEEERRANKVAAALNKQRRAKSKAKQERAKRSKLE